MLTRYLLTALFAATAIIGLLLIPIPQSSAEDKRVRLNQKEVQALEKCWGACRTQYQKDIAECKNKPENERPACEDTANERYKQCKLECIPNF